jgi:alpha-mannosidase
VTSQQQEGMLSSTSSFIHIEPDAFRITAIKPSEDGDGWILRGANLTDELLKCRVQFHLPVKEVRFASLAEETLEELPVSSESSISFDAPPHKVITLKIRNH